MTTTNLMSLPIDIPWKRLAFSKDMMDLNINDRIYPPRWRSSVSIFYHEPPAEEQPFQDRIITYIKVSCSITGFQYETKGAEVIYPFDQTPGKAWNYGWINNYEEAVRPYYPCYGALIQVVAFPRGLPGTTYEPNEFPFIQDYEPKKRELYEAASDKSDFLSQSRSVINVKKGKTTTEYSESGSNFGANLGWSAGQAGGLTAGVTGGINNKSGTSTETVDVSTVDFSRERRENYSYTTSLNHMYHLLSSYHLGTNRALFFVQPRPHIKQDEEYSFVKGPRELEGIQDFFLIIERPKKVPSLCVEATLETGHLATESEWVGRPVPKSDFNRAEIAAKKSEKLGIPADVWLEFLVYGKYPSFSSDYVLMGNNTSQKIIEDWVLKEKRIDINMFYHHEIEGISSSKSPNGSWNDISPAKRVHIASWVVEGRGFESLNPYTWAGDWYSTYNDQIISKLKELGEHISEREWRVVEELLGYGINPMDDLEVVYDRIYSKTGKFFITGRVTKGCLNYAVEMKIPDEYLSFDGKFSEEDVTFSAKDAHAWAMNKIKEKVRLGMIDSLTSPDRFSPGEASFLDATFVQKRFLETLKSMPDDDDYNVKIEDIDELGPEIKSKLRKLVGIERRKDVLNLNLNQLQVALQLSKTEARLLLTKLIGKGPTFKVEPGKVPVIVPSVLGMTVEASKQLLAQSMLNVDKEIICQDSIEMKDTVLSQYPDSGNVANYGDTISLVVSSGPVVIPKINGLRVEDAYEKLKDCSLRVLKRNVTSDELPPDHVISSTPSEGTSVTRNSEVVLLVVKQNGKEESEIKSMPDPNVEKSS